MKMKVLALGLIFGVVGLASATKVGQPVFDGLTITGRNGGGLTVSSGPVNIQGVSLSGSSATYTGTLSVAGAASLSSTLSVAGASTLTGPVSSVSTMTARGVGKLVSVTTAAASTASIGFCGAFQTLPTDGYPEGCLAYQLSDHLVYASTEPVRNAASWKAQ